MKRVREKNEEKLRKKGLLPAKEAVEEQKNEDEESDDLDNEEEGGEWVTEDNLHSHISHARKL